MLQYKEVFQLAQDKGYKSEFSVNLETVNLQSQFSDHYPEYGRFIDLCLIQKWLRDEHKIDTTPTFERNELGLDCQYLPNCDCTSDCGVLIEYTGEPISYEEALLQGINETLKLI